MNTIDRVIELSKARNINLHQLAQLSEIPYSTLKSAQVRRCQLSVDTIECICSGLGITLSDFFANIKSREETV